MTTPRILRIPDPPPNRGRFLDVQGVRDLLGGRVTADWVYAHVPHKVRLSRRCVGWWELDVRAWLEAQRESDHDAA